MDALLAVAIVNLVFFVMPAVRRLGESFAPAHTLTVTAQGKTLAAPDLAEISFSVVTQGANPSDLSNLNDQKMNAAIGFLESQGIATSDIATADYSLAPIYQSGKTVLRGGISGYMLTQTVTVKVRDLSKVASVLGGLAPLGVNQVGSVDFTFSDGNKALAAARADAFSLARAKAQEMAQEAGVSLGRPVSVAENSYLPQPFYGAMDSAVALSAGSAAVPNLQPGTREITDSVTIVYETK